jgi:hypothetical protein
MATAGREAPFRIGINHSGRKGLILLDQVRAVDKTRLGKKLGVVSAKTLTATLRTLQKVFAECASSTGVASPVIRPQTPWWIALPFATRQELFHTGAVSV